MNNAWPSVLKQGIIPTFAGRGLTGGYLEPSIGPASRVQGAHVRLDEFLRLDPIKAEVFIGRTLDTHNPVPTAVTTTAYWDRTAAYVLEGDSAAYDFAHIPGAQQESLLTLGFRNHPRHTGAVSEIIHHHFNEATTTRHAWFPIRRDVPFTSTNAPIFIAHSPNNKVREVLAAKALAGYRGAVRVTLENFMGDVGDRSFSSPQSISGVATHAFKHGGKEGVLVEIEANNKPYGRYELNIFREAGVLMVTQGAIRFGHLTLRKGNGGLIGRKPFRVANANTDSHSTSSFLVVSI